MESTGGGREDKGDPVQEGIVRRAYYRDGGLVWAGIVPSPRSDFSDRALRFSVALVIFLCIANQTNHAHTMPGDDPRPIGMTEDKTENLEEDKKVRGLHTRRLSQNPIEKALSDGWAEEIVSVSPINKNTLLDGLLELQGRENNRPIGYATDRDHIIAATVVQWLGSPVGFSFLQRALEEVGYEVKKID